MNADDEVGGPPSHAQRRFEDALRAARLGTWEWNVQTGATVFNERWAEIVGRTLGDLQPVSIETWITLAHPEDLERSNQRLQDHFQGKAEVYECECRMQHADGGWVWVRDVGRVITWTEGGEPLLMTGTHEDITDHKRVQAELERSEQNYRLLFDALSQGIITRGPDGLITGVNAAAERLLGVPAARLIGATGLLGICRVVRPDGTDLPREENPARIAQNTRAPVREVLIGVEPEAQAMRWLLVDAVPRLSSDRKHLEQVFTTFRDVTAQRHAELEAQRLEKELQQAQRMEAVGRLAGGMAHDLNNLLTPILGYSEVLVEELAPEGSLAAGARAIEQAGLRARDLIQQLLAVGRRTTLRTEAIDLRRVVRDMQPLLQRAVREDIDLRVETAAEVVSVFGDLRQLEQVLMNLVINASDAMPLGGALNITVEPRTIGRGHAHLRPGRHVQLTVTDTGVGMDEATRGRIFEPFFTTKGDKGSGLGLAAAYGIVRQHGGTVEVTSQLDVGTEFRVVFPAYLERRPVRAPARELAARLRRAKGDESILVVDDDQQVRDLAAMLLRRLGYAVQTSARGDEALSLLVRGDMQPDLLLTDVVMPGLDGRMLFERASASQPSLSVLYMSGYAAEVLDGRGISLADGCLLYKPFTVADLTDKVREILDLRR